ncbi:unnamed protein product [Paramecium pentaurelia]|uniref:Uncharacterized protein n=1 Tax=Paramecium pentaurelia TaxID=43138 RepID=A0A8S1W0E9_9CILI|nr:unnamed protein product [Paramecium pentaurelia]
MSSFSPKLTKVSTKTGFIGTFEAELFAQQQNTQLRAQRMQQIRKQETDLTKKKIQQQQQIQQKQQEEEMKKQKYQEYLQKKAQIEQLEQARQQTILEQQRQAREAEEYRQREYELQQEKLKMQAYYEEQAQKRYQEAQEWKKQSFLETSQGKALQIQNQRKEASIIEKQKEAQSVAIYKETSKNKTQSTFTQDLESYEKFDKNISRRQILKPEDFANTCFHNPQVVKHDIDLEKENAMEKANQTMIETQAMLLEQARQKREQERAQKQRSQKALSKERQIKVLEQLEQETKFIKKQEIIQLQKTKPPTRKPKSDKNHQKLLSTEFDKMFNCNNSQIEVRDHRVRSNSPKKSLTTKNKEKQRPKSVKIFTKAPLDTNLLNDPQKESLVKEDYTKYAIGSEDQSTSQKKKVQFSDMKNESPQSFQNKEIEQTLKISNSKSPYQHHFNNELVHSNENSEEEEEQNNQEEQINETDQEDQNEEQQSDVDSPPQLKSNQIQDIRLYIKEQEQYLQKLEQQRINTKMKIKEEESNLVQSFKNTRKQQFSKQPIPEESEDESSYQQSPSQMNQEESDRQQQSFQQQSQFQNQDQTSPETQNLQKSSYFETIDNFDTQDIMEQFLKPKKTTNNQNKQLSLFADPQSSQKQTISSQQKQSQFVTLQQMNSPNSELNYSLSEVKNVTSPIKKYEFQQTSPPLAQQHESSLKKDSIDSEQMKYSLQQSSEQLQDLVQQEYEETLGEIFQKRKAMLAKKFENRQDSKTIEKGGKSKEELIQIRKEMLKSKRQVEKEKQIQEESQQEPSEQELRPIEQQEDKRASLMKRLAMGEKVKVDKKEMKELTNKNYELLPEVKKKKDEQEKNENIKSRKQKVKEMDQKLRETMKQKRQQCS